MFVSSKKSKDKSHQSITTSLYQAGSSDDLALFFGDSSSSSIAASHPDKVADGVYLVLNGLDHAA